MPAKTSSHTATAADSNDPFEYDASMETAFEPRRNDNDQRRAETGQGHGNGAVDVAIDEEVKIVKKRQPVAKLDEARLLSPAGIPKLRKISKERIKFKGKGHEFSDMARLLNTYQLWLDDMYPRAKFLDGLAIIEKLGHSKRIQIMRKAWIDESKPKPAYSEEEERIGELVEGPGMAPEPIFGDHSSNERQPEDIQGARSQITGPSVDDVPDEDELDALLAEDATTSAAKAPLSETTHENIDDEIPEDDELDALLAEDDLKQNGGGSSNKKGTNPVRGIKSLEINDPHEEDFAAEMDVLAEMDGAW